MEFSYCDSDFSFPQEQLCCLCSSLDYIIIRKMEYLSDYNTFVTMKCKRLYVKETTRVLLYVHFITWTTVISAVRIWYKNYQWSKATTHEQLNLRHIPVECFQSSDANNIAKSSIFLDIFGILKVGNNEFMFLSNLAINRFHRIDQTKPCFLWGT